MKTKPIVICLTPVKNEAWILERFLQSTSLWADHIIIADQMSTDGSREIALKFPKVKLIDNNSEEFNEPERQRLLINEARKIEGQKLLIAIDADEIFTPNILNCYEWQEIQNVLPGTFVKFEWVNLRPDFKLMWYGAYFPWGYMDNGLEHSSTNYIHTHRLPYNSTSPVFIAKEIKLMHLQYTNWQRMQHKQLWYQCIERVKYPEKSAIDIFRTYTHMFALENRKLNKVPSDWLEEYENVGISIQTNSSNNYEWFEENILKLIEKYGIKYFSKNVIWHKNWSEIAKKTNKLNNSNFSDPRKIIDILVQIWLWNTKNIANNKYVKKMDRKLIKYFNY